MMRQIGGYWLDCMKPTGNMKMRWEWQKVLALSEEPQTDDQIHLAKAAFQAGKYAESLEMCKTVVDKDPFNGIACCYLGQSAAGIGRQRNCI
jgi:Flp pilus assembly protein TadD